MDAWVWSLIDEVLVSAGIVFLIARQFLWRDADPRRLLRLPVAIVSLGVVYLAVDVAGVRGLSARDGALLLLEVLLVSGTGMIMGRATVIRHRDGRLRYRLTGRGAVLWGVFLVIRVGSLLLAARIGATLLETTGTVLVSFGVNRLASSLVVRHRVLMSEVGVVSRS